MPAPILLAPEDSMQRDFPLRPFAIRHALAEHPLLTLPRLAQLAAELPRDLLEYNSGAAAIDQNPDETPTLEVGNPVRLTNGGTNTDLFRVRRGSTLISYGTMFGTSLPEALRFDVEIRGAAGSIPYTSLPSALRMPASFAVTSPATDSARSFDAAAGLPIRWDTVPGEDAEVTVLVFSRSDPTTAAYAELNDDGSETLSLAGFPTLRGLVTINLQRTVRRYERLETGPSVMLVGTRGVTFDAELR